MNERQVEERATALAHELSAGRLRGHIAWLSAPAPAGVKLNEKLSGLYGLLAIRLVLVAGRLNALMAPWLLRPALLLLAAAGVLGASFQVLGASFQHSARAALSLDGASSCFARQSDGAAAQLLSRLPPPAQMAVASDMLAACTLHLAALHGGFSFILSRQLQAASALW